MIVLGLWPLWLAAAPERGTAFPRACPEGFAERPARAQRLAQRMARDPDARPLLRGDVFALCFGDGIEAGIAPGGAVLLPEDMPDDRAAARVAHLLHHRLPGSPFVVPPDTDCATWTQRARAEEETAHALEARILVRAGLNDRPSSLDRLADAYAARCNDARENSEAQARLARASLFFAILPSLVRPASSTISASRSSPSGSFFSAK
jgi:hypothetical protein